MKKIEINIEDLQDLIDDLKLTLKHQDYFAGWKIESIKSKIKEMEELMELKKE